MAEDLQALLDRIKDEGFKKTEQQCEELLSKASAEAKRIVEEARTEAASIIRTAQDEAAMAQNKGQMALQQAARDVLLSLRHQLEERVVRAATSFAGEALSDGRLVEIITRLFEAYLAGAGSEGRVQVLLAETDAKALESALSAALSQDLRKQVEITPVPEVSAGFRLVFAGTDIVYDFTDEALAEALAEFLNPHLAALLEAH